MPLVPLEGEDFFPASKYPSSAATDDGYFQYKSNIRKYEKYHQEYKNQNGHAPSEEEVCGELGISARSLKYLEKTIYTMCSISLDAPAAGYDDMAQLDFLKSDQDIEEAVTYSVYRKELHKELDTAMNLLDKKTREMIYNIYYQRNSMTQTAALFHCSRQNVYDRIGKGFYHLLHSPCRARLESFMEEGFQYSEKIYSNYAELDETENEFIV